MCVHRDRGREAGVCEEKGLEAVYRATEVLPTCVVEGTTLDETANTTVRLLVWDLELCARPITISLLSASPLWFSYSRTLKESSLVSIASVKRSGYRLLCLFVILFTSDLYLRMRDDDLAFNITL